MRPVRCKHCGEPCLFIAPNSFWNKVVKTPAIIGRKGSTVFCRGKRIGLKKWSPVVQHEPEPRFVSMVRRETA